MTNMYLCAYALIKEDQETAEDEHAAASSLDMVNDTVNSLLNERMKCSMSLSYDV